MSHQAGNGPRFLAALAAGGVVAAILIGLGVTQPIAVVSGWVVFLGLGSFLAGTLPRHRHRH